MLIEKALVILQMNPSYHTDEGKRDENTIGKDWMLPVIAGKKQNETPENDVKKNADPGTLFEVLCHPIFRHLLPIKMGHDHRSLCPHLM
jgi:hypothetical protein